MSLIHRRGLFFAHRRLANLLDTHERGDEIFVYTGRGPSAYMHLGHLIPFMFSAWLQQVFRCQVRIQIADDEKYYFKGMSWEELDRQAARNRRDIMLCGFDPDRTVIFSNREQRREPSYDRLACEIKRAVSVNTMQKIYGFTGDTSVGELEWPVWQCTAAFGEAYGGRACRGIRLGPRPIFSPHG